MASFTYASLVCALLVSTAFAHTATPASDAARSEATRKPATTAANAPYRMSADLRGNIAEHPAWTAPQRPFRIYGNTWFVGTRGLGVFLIASSGGHILIDGGVPGDAVLIEANLRQLGIRLHDIKWILNTHAHSDHAGDLARLAADTGAKVIANVADAPLLERGGNDDPQYGNGFAFPPVHVDRTVVDGEVLHLGDLTITAHATPGHTKGNTTWTWTSCEGRRCLAMVDVGSLSAPGFHLVGNARYPDIVRDFEHSFAVVADLPCDIPIAPHPEMVDFWERVAKRKQDGTDAMIDPAGCRAYATDARQNFEAELATQQKSMPAAQQKPGLATQQTPGLTTQQTPR
ncbi:subclass B3 metallo-beta-lactamase [Xanthomonas sp. NCPPB 2632]|uniref:subclass B3 metallo-beta-lactamase n=1 Tax=Xanthomonas sp. NCPPB 2632 TaxID=3240912 RepID=UPI003513D3E5